MFPKTYPRPKRFSNRNCCYSDEGLAAILRKRDDELTWSDFEAIFSVSNCAATYDEQLYFVPLAFAHQARHPGDGREYISGFVEFFIRNADALERAGVLRVVQSEFDGLLRTWTEWFRVTHFDRAASEKKGWSIEYLDVVQNSEGVTELMERLLAHESLASVSEEFVRRLAMEDSTVIEAAWFLELARAVQDCTVDFFVPGARGRVEPLPDHPATRVQSLLTDPSILERQFARAAKDGASLGQESPTYWRDVATALGLAA